MPMLYPVIATRGRPVEVIEQVARLLCQLLPGERVIVVVDGDNLATIALSNRDLLDQEGLSLVELSTRNGVNFARRIGNCHVPPHGIIVEVDDHDWIEEGCLAAIRKAYENPEVHFVYGDCVAVDPTRKARNVERGKKAAYNAGAFRARHCAWGLRSFRSWLYHAVGQWPVEENESPGGDMILCMRMEALLQEAGMLGMGRGIVHLPQVLNNVVISAEDGISAQAALDKDESGANAQQRNVAAAVQAIASGEWTPPMSVEQMRESAQALGIPVGDSAPRQATRPKRSKPLAMICHTRFGQVATKEGMSKVGGGEMSSAYWKPALEEVGFEVEVRCTDECDPEVATICTTQEMAGEIRKVRPDIVVVRDGFQGTSARWKFSQDGVESYTGLVGVCRELGIPVIVRCQFWRGIVDCWVETVWEDLHYGAQEGIAIEHPEELAKQSVLCEYGGWDHWRGTAREYLERVRDKEGTVGLWQSNGIITNSEFCTRAVDACMRSPRAETEWPTIPLEPILAKERDPQYVLMPAGQTGKGLDTFVQFARDFPDEQFVVLAPHGPEGAMLAELNLPNMTVLEHQTDMAAVYAKAKVVFIGTQTAETFCRAAAEARANGIPLLVSDAGNLPSFVENGGGLCMPRKAPYEEWLKSLAVLLEPNDCIAAMLDIGPDEQFCQGSVDVLPGMARDLTAGHGIVVVYPRGAPGVSNGVRHLAAVTGASMRASDDMGSLDPTSCAGVVLCGGLLPEYVTLIEQAECPVALNWRSHLLQMGFHVHELEQFRRALDVVAEHPNMSMMASYEDSAMAWAEAYGIKTAWLPDCYDEGLTPPPWLRPEKEAEFTIPLLGPVCPRKNLQTVALAAKLADVRVIASEWIRRDPILAAHIDGLGLNIEWRDLPTEDDVVNLISSCHALVLGSVAETFGYTACHAMLAGVPVIGSALIPMTDYEDEELINTLSGEPCSAKDLSILLRVIREDPEDYGLFCQRRARAIIRRNNAQARDTLREFVGASK